jgi:acyl-CoA synthetase (AMP-forming)/AMP-acid ligase II
MAVIKIAEDGPWARSEAFGPPLSEDPATIKQMLIQNAKRHGNRLALISMHQRHSQLPSPQASELPASDRLQWTHTQLMGSATRLVVQLRKLGVRPGQPLATLLPSSAEWVAFAFASVLLGCPLVPLNARAMQDTGSIVHSLRASKTTVLVVATLQQAKTMDTSMGDSLNKINIKVVLDECASQQIEGWQKLTAANDDVEESEPDDNIHCSAKEAAMFVFTSGKAYIPALCFRE